MLSEAVVGMSKIGRSSVPLMLDLMVQEHERDMRAWHAEWEALPEICIITGGALETLTAVMRGLEVSPERMLANLGATNGLIVSERAMMELAPRIGRERAHDLVYEASMTAFEEDRPLAEVLVASEAVRDGVASREELEALLDPATYTGLCAEFADRVLAAWADGSIP